MAHPITLAGTGTGINVEVPVHYSISDVGACLFVRTAEDAFALAQAATDAGNRLKLMADLKASVARLEDHPDFPATTFRQPNAGFVL